MGLSVESSLSMLEVTGVGGLVAVGVSQHYCGLLVEVTIELALSFVLMACG
jgi:hypothetical protein